MASVNKETQMNLLFKVIRTAFIVLLVATFLGFIGAVGGFGGPVMIEVASVATGGIIGCIFVIWASDQVVNFTGGE